MNELNSKKPWQCRTCAYAKTSGDLCVCDLGVREQKHTWGNNPSFGCTKWKEKK